MFIYLVCANYPISRHSLLQPRSCRKRLQNKPLPLKGKISNTCMECSAASKLQINLRAASHVIIMYMQQKGGPSLPTQTFQFSGLHPSSCNTIAVDLFTHSWAIRLSALELFRELVGSRNFSSLAPNPALELWLSWSQISSSVPAALAP